GAGLGIGPAAGRAGPHLAGVEGAGPAGGASPRLRQAVGGGTACAARPAVALPAPARQDVDRGRAGGRLAAGGLRGPAEWHTGDGPALPRPASSNAPLPDGGGGGRRPGSADGVRRLRAVPGVRRGAPQSRGAFGVL